MERRRPPPAARWRSSRWPRRSWSSCAGPGGSSRATREVEGFRRAVARPRRPGRDVARRRRAADRCGPPPAGSGRTGLGDTIAAARDASGATPRRPRRSSGPRRGGRDPRSTSSPSWSGASGRSRWSSTARRSWPRSAAASASSRRRPSIKRGYLNLLHAREAIARHAARAEALEPGRPPQAPGSRWRPSSARRPTTPRTTPSSGILGRHHNP